MSETENLTPEQVADKLELDKAVSAIRRTVIRLYVDSGLRPEPAAVWADDIVATFVYLDHVSKEKPGEYTSQLITALTAVHQHGYQRALQRLSEAYSQKALAAAASEELSDPDVGAG